MKNTTVIVALCCGLIGWCGNMFDVPAIVTIVSGWPIMRPLTATCIIAACVSIFALTRGKVTLAATAAVGIMGAMIYTTLSVASGQASSTPPSIGTVVSLFAVGFGLIVAVAHNPLARPIINACAAVPITLGTVSLLGYALSRPLLYWSIGGTFPGMAFLTSIALVSLGLSMLTIAGTNQNERR